MSPKERLFAEFCRTLRAALWALCLLAAADRLADHHARGVRANVQAQLDAQAEMIKLLKEAGIEKVEIR